MIKSASYISPIFISYTSLSDYLTCPRLYFFKNIYRDSKSGFKIQIISPYISLGAVVHDTIKWFLQIKGQASSDQLEKKFRNLWFKYQGRKGGFLDRVQEAEFGKRGLKMIDNFFNNWLILGQAVDSLSFPKYNLTDDIILTGNLDYAGLLSDGSLQIVDFKTGSRDEEETIQLHIYAILAEKNYGKVVSKISFWYLDRDGAPKEAVLDPLEGKIKWLTEKALVISEAVKKNIWLCVKNPETCRECKAYQGVLDGKGQWLFSDFAYKKEVYYLSNNSGS